MTTLQTKTFDAAVEEQAVAVQSSASGVLADYSVGSILRAIAEAVAAVVMWLQGLILQLLATTRAATSSGADLDTWMADYGLTRLAATAATGDVTFARFTPTLQATVPVGALVQTADGVQYAVIADTTKAAWSATLGAYVLPAATASIAVKVQALAAGVTGNALAGTITTLGQALAGIDTVTNALALVSGADAETDAAFRARFAVYIGSLAKATKTAIKYALTNTGLGLTDVIVEAQDYSGAYKPGYFYTVVDDGSGAPSSGTLAAATGAIDGVRACGIQFAVFAPTSVTATIALAVTIATGYDAATVRAAVSSAITAYIASLTMGDSLTWSRLYQVAYDATPGVASVTGLTINGGTTDLTATAKQVIVAGSVTVG